VDYRREKKRDWDEWCPGDAALLGTIMGVSKKKRAIGITEDGPHERW